MIPEKIKIGAIPYTVGFPPDLDSDLIGLIDYRKQTISIRPGMGAEVTRETLMHEVVHGMVNALGYVEHDELMIDGMAHMLLQVADDNPGLFTRSE